MHRVGLESTKPHCKLTFSLLVSQPENGMDMEIKLPSVDLVYPQFGSIPSRRERWTSFKSGSRDLSNFAVMRSFEQSNWGCGAVKIDKMEQKLLKIQFLK